ncbi:MAG: heme NO-binding domain-containing protein [Schleiferiaceae bacterium]|jgi:hypothetical protein|nr:heme NO-binding domain-containing protein [Schleiferiaceae bacterium]
MKGVVFTELLEMVEEKFGYSTVDSIIEKSNLPNDGAYTSIGTYDFSEMGSLVLNLHKETKIPIPDLLQTYGEYFFSFLAKNYTPFLDRANGLFDFLDSIHNYIHVEVKKLYPDAELPAFETVERNEVKMVMNYTSERKLGDFAKGLMLKSGEYFNEDISIEAIALNESGSQIQFVITKN